MSDKRRGHVAPIVPKQDWPRANENAAAAEERKAADAGMPPPSATNSWARDWRLDTKAGGKGLDLAAAAVGKWPRGTLPRRAASKAIRNEATATSETDAGPISHLVAGGETQGGFVRVVPSLCPSLCSL
ncbi:hypothetical protein L1887_43297 [Cichorium endivia]|nr:hypothetical protein L1887_43297 [Cichorium endivia]